MVRKQGPELGNKKPGHRVRNDLTYRSKEEILVAEKELMFSYVKHLAFQI